MADDLSSLQPEVVESVSKHHRAQFVFWAIGTAALPTYVFGWMLGLPIGDNVSLHAAGLAAMIIALFLSYEARMEKWGNKLLDQRETVIRNTRSGKDKTPVDTSALEHNTKEEAAYLSILYNNLVFLLSFVLFSFFMFFGYSEIVNYIAAVPLSAFVTYSVATNTRKHKGRRA